MAKTSWFDEGTEIPALHERVQKLESFTAAMADGVVDENELQGQRTTAGSSDEAPQAQTERRASRAGHEV
jgi:hypothetical protein